MRYARYGNENPDVVDMRDTTPSPLPPYPGGGGDAFGWDPSEMIRMDEARRRENIHFAVAAATFGLAGFLLGRSMERERRGARRSSASRDVGRPGASSRRGMSAELRRRLSER
jgi:hypothetical protein